jgi:hypothetical protein
MPVSNTGKLLALDTSECAQLCVELLLSSRLPVWLHAKGSGWSLLVSDQASPQVGEGWSAG